MLFRICAVLCNFYPRPPRGGRPVCFAAGRVSVSISIHALREEGDSSPIFKKVAILNFYPRPPRGGRRGVCAGIVAPELISIHALREEGDNHTITVEVSDGKISIHALREEGDVTPFPRQPRNNLFLSTPSARRATRPSRLRRATGAYFYPRPPRGGRRRRLAVNPEYMQISIHALREEGDPVALNVRLKASNFYPRPPRGGRLACSPRFANTG